MPRYQINSTHDIKCNIKLNQFEKIISNWIRKFNNNINQNVTIIFINKDIEMIIMDYCYVLANEKDIKQRTIYDNNRTKTSSTNAKRVKHARYRGRVTILKPRFRPRNQQ